MSHAYGFARIPSGRVLFFEYDGTADICIPKLYATCEEVYKFWRKGEADTWADCPHYSTVPVDIATDYGYGYGWKGTACLECPRLLTGLNPYDGEIEWDWSRSSSRDRDPEWANQVWNKPFLDSQEVRKS